MQYTEISFRLRLNDHRYDVFDRNGIPTCHHFAQDKHRFNKHAKFTLIESIANANKQKKPYRKF